MKPAAHNRPSIVPGSVIASRFRVDRPLGRGSMGSVWLARHLSLNVDVAVKFIDPAFRNTSDTRARFAVEAQAAARINSPHVVNVLDFGNDASGRPYIAMEYLEGEDVGQLLKRWGKLSPTTTRRIVSHACNGLARAHALGIVHRDIKPENLFLCGGDDCDEPIVKILDFGVAKVGQDLRNPLDATQAGQLIGSPAYMSPEQARGARTIDTRSDLFSIGVVAYHCLTGTLPFIGEALGELLLAIVGNEPKPVTTLVPELPAGLDEWFAKALAKHPDQRFQSAREMSEAYEAALGRLLASAAPDGSSFQEAGPAPDPEASVNSAQALRTTRSRELASALGQVADVSGVLGVALMNPDGECLAHRSTMGMEPASFVDVMQGIRDALDTFEAVDMSQPRTMGLHFESAVVFVRWIDDYPLLVIGIESVHPAVLSVSLTGAATKLSLLARRHGSPQVAFAPAKSPNALENHSGIVTTVSEDDPVPEAMLARFTSLVTAELGPLARLGIQRHLKTEGRPRFRDFAALVGKVTSLANDSPLVRDRLREAALKLMPPGLVASAPRQAVAAAQSALEAPRPMVGDEFEKATIVLGPTDIAEGTPSGITDGPEIEISECEESEALADVKKQPTRRKRTYVYRGRVYESDD